jgi:hypothetical protein
MKFDFHPEAFAALNEQANQVAEAAALKPPSPHKKPAGFKPDVHIAANLTSAHLQGPIQMFQKDEDGNDLSRFIQEGPAVVGFDQAAYAKLRKVARSIQKTGTFRTMVSVQFVEDALFHWSLRKLKGNTDKTACEYIASEAEQKVCHQEIWIPIYGLHIQSSFRLGPIVFKTISRQMVDEWQRPVRERFPEKPEIHSKLDREKKELLGFAAATYETEAEPEWARETASDLADKAISILRLFSAANFDPRQFSYCVPLGSHQRYGYHTINVRDAKIIGQAQGIIGKGQFPWVIDDAWLKEMNDLQTIAGALFDKEPKTSMDELVFDSLLLYSKATLVPTLAEKLLYMFAALESVLLRDENEPITESISERLAYLSADELESRLAARKSVKGAYGVRSRFVHHGKREGKDLTDFFRYAWTALWRIAEIATQFKTKSELLDYIEQYKYRK